MKMVKSLLLGSAAGLVAVSAGQAADLPVKAKPVQYVKVCSLYGAGFYYMPGTDICLKIGGYVRAETTYHSNGNFAAGPTAGDVNNRTTNEFVMRARAYITADAREQTAWGTARAYVAVGVATTDVGNSLTPSILGFNRAFIQWAGITAGISQSFYDFFEGFAVRYRAYLPGGGGTGDTGWWVWAYTAQLGNGLSATISAEQRRISQIVGFVGTTAAGTCFATVTLALPFACRRDPDRRHACGYGGLQVAGHRRQCPARPDLGERPGQRGRARGQSTYYGTALSNGISETGHPSDRWGWVACAGLRLNFPMVAQGDYFQTQANYTQGATRYMNQANNAPNFGWERGGNFGFGVMSDCVFASSIGSVSAVPPVNSTGCNLTTGWQRPRVLRALLDAAIPRVLTGAYENVRYNSQPMPYFVWQRELEPSAPAVEQQRSLREVVTTTTTSRRRRRGYSTTSPRPSISASSSCIRTCIRRRCRAMPLRAPIGPASNDLRCWLALCATSGT